MSDLINIEERCPNCLMPYSTPEIFKTEQGICNLCRDYQPVQLKGRQSLLSDLVYPDNQTRKVDCLVPISGGLDSIYTAFFLVHNMGLRCLGVHYDNGMGSDNKAEMLGWVQEKLGMEIILYAWDDQKSRRLVRDSLRSMLEIGPKSMQAAYCRHCGYGIRAAVFSEMVRHDLHSVWGKHTMDHIPFRYNQPVSLKQLILQKHGLAGLRSLFRRYQQAKVLTVPGNDPVKLMLSPMGYPSLPETHIHLKNLTFFEYIAWNKQRMLQELQDNGLNIQELANFHSDCNLAPAVDRTLHAAWSVGKKEVYVCNMIRDGQISVEEGKRQIDALHAADLDTTFLAEIGLTQSEIANLFINNTN